MDKAFVSYRRNLTNYLFIHGFVDAEKEIDTITRRDTLYTVQDKVELWKEWENKDKWPWDADKVSVKDWRKRAKEWRYG